MKILTLLFFSLSLGHAQKPIPDRFRNIGNQTYYEYLDSDMHDSLEVIRERFLREMKKWHADDKERAQLLNEAFDAIKKEDVRERYNQWLLGQKYSFNSNTQDSRSTGNSARSREDVLHLIFKMIEVHLQQRGFIDSLTYLAEIGRTAITYNQRFLPGASFEASDFNSLFDWSLPEYRSRLYGNWIYNAAALGAIQFLKERRFYDSAIDILYRKVIGDLASGIRQAQTYQHQVYLDKIFEFAEGYSYLVSWAGPQHARSNCESTVTAYLEIRDAYGRVVGHMPVNVSIKIGF